MSAYVVDRNHIRYLVEAAQHIAIREHSPSLTWYHNGQRQELNELNASEVGQMLWNENIESVQYRYPDDTDDSMPGPMGETYIYYHQTCPEQGRRMAGTYFKFDVAQILKAADCYEYQSCEHPTWESSSAHNFIRALVKRALVKRTYTHLDGYDDAEWGAPEMSKNEVSMELGSWAEFSGSDTAPSFLLLLSPGRRGRFLPPWQFRLLNMRPKIESVFDYLKEHLNLVSSFARSVNGYLLHYLRWRFRNFDRLAILV